MIHVLSRLKTSVGVQRGKGGQLGTRKVCRKVFNTIIQMEAGRLRENPQTPQRQETPQAIKPPHETK